MAQKPIDLKLYFEVQDFMRIPKPDEKSKDGLSKAGSLYNPPLPVLPLGPFDEVYPKLILGNRKLAQNLDQLKSVGITHIINASMGPKFNQINTSQEFYQECNIVFHGIAAMDVASFQIFPFLKDAADFIEQALNDNGTVYVHCQQGMSRSATVVLAFLMLKRDMDLMSAAKLVRSKRLIYPNDGFIKQLCQLQKEIKDSKMN